MIFVEKSLIYCTSCNVREVDGFKVGFGDENHRVVISLCEECADDLALAIKLKGLKVD